MLVLTRKSGEAICIDGDIVVKVLRIRGGRIRLGIEAPLATSVRRIEVRAKIGQADEMVDEASLEARPR